MQRVKTNLTKILSAMLVLTLVLSSFCAYDLVKSQNTYAALSTEEIPPTGPGGIYNPTAAAILDPGISTGDLCYCSACGIVYHASKGHICGTDIPDRPINVTHTCAICGEETTDYITTQISSTSTYFATYICTDCATKYGATSSDTVRSLYEQIYAKKQELATANANLATQTQLTNNYKAQVESQKTTINQLTSENATLKSDKASLTTQLTNANNEIARLQAALDGKLAEYEQALEEEKTRLQAEIDDLKTQIAAKDREIQSLNTTIAEKDKKINELTAKITSLEEGIAGMNTEINDLLADIEQKKAAIKSLDDRIAAADGDIEALTAERNALSAEVSSKEDLCDALNKQIQENQTTIGRLNGDLATLQEEKESLEAEKQAEIDSLNQSVAAYDAELAEKYAAIIDLNTRIEKKDGDIEALNAELTKITNETMELLQRKDEAIHESTEKILELTNKLQANYIAMNTLEGELTTARGGIKDLQNEIIRLTAEIDRLNQSNAALSQKLADQQLYYERLLKNFADSLQYVVPENSGYTYKDSRTGKTYVCIFGHDCLYDPESGVLRTLTDGTEVTTYKALIDTDYDGEYDKHFWFYIAEDGVHYITFAEDGSIDRDELSQTTVKDLQNLVSGQINSLTDELNAAREELKTLKNGINTVYEYIKAILEELNIEFDVPDVGPDPDPNPNPNPNPNPTPDNTDIAKLTEIMQMVRKVADKYKELEGKYNKVSADYASVITAVYGTDEPSGSELTPEEVINQLQEEREEAKKKADELAAELTDVKAELASTENEMNKAIATLTDALEEEKKVSGEKSDELTKAIEEANGLNEQLQIACDQIKALRASLNAMNSFVKTLGTALGLENIEDTAAILAAVSNLQEQVKTLTKENGELNNTITSLNSQISSMQGILSQMNTQILSLQNENSALKNEIEAYKASANGETTRLTQMVTDLSTENSILKNENSTLKYGIDEIHTLMERSAKSSVPEIAKATAGANGKSYEDKIDEIKGFYAILTGNLDGLNIKNKALYDKAQALWKTKAGLENKLTELEAKNKKLGGTNETLTAEIRSLRAQIDALNAEIERLKAGYVSEEIHEEVIPEVIPTEEAEDEYDPFGETEGNKSDVNPVTPSPKNDTTQKVEPTNPTLVEADSHIPVLPIAGLVGLAALSLIGLLVIKLMGKKKTACVGISDDSGMEFVEIDDDDDDNIVDSTEENTEE